MKFEYKNPIKFYFGNDVFEKIPDLCEGKKVLLVYGGGSIKKTGVYDQITTLLENAKIPFVEYGNQTKATYQAILDGINLAKREQVEAGCETLKELMKESGVPLTLRQYGECPSDEFILQSLEPEDLGEFTPEEMCQMVKGMYQ